MCNTYLATVEKKKKEKKKKKKKKRTMYKSSVISVL